MRDTSPTPNIAVTIGGQLRVYYAYVTTAGPDFDGPTTMTLLPYQESDLAIGLLLELDRQGFNLKFTPDNHVGVRPFGRLTSMRACWSSGDVTGRPPDGIGWPCEAHRLELGQLLPREMLDSYAPAVVT